MRGESNPQSSLFSYVSLESRIPEQHPIRKVRKVVDRALKDMKPEFEGMYSPNGRPSIPPEKLIRALLLQILFTIRSERQLIERLDYDLEGKISLKDKIVSYRAGTNQLLKSIVDARGDGALDGNALQAYNQSSLRLLGIRLLENRLILEVPPSKKISDGNFLYHCSKRMLFGDLSLNLGTDLGFRNPSAEGGASIELGGWDAMSGKISLDLYRAILEFEALGIDITVIAPSVKSISPSLLLKILADLLKVDIKALLEMDLDEIVINLMDPGGGIDQQKNKDDGGEDEEERKQEETCPDGTPRPCGAPIPVPVPPPPPPIPCTEDCQDPIREEEPGEPGYFACLEQLPSRYEFDRIYGTHEVKEHRHNGTLQQLVDWHPVTFGKAEYSNLCSGYKLNGAWKPVMARQRINYNQYHDYQCDDENRMNIPVEAYKKATWNEDGHGYFCGTVPIGDSQSYQQVRRLELDSVSYDEWETLDRKRKHFVSDVYQRKLITAFNTLVPEFAQYGKAKRNHDFTRLTFERDCYVGWNCDRKVFLEVFFEPPSQLHTWKQAFQLFYHQDKFWYLSMCEDTNFMRNKAGLDIHIALV